MVVGLSRFHRRPSLAPMLLTKLLALSVAVPDLQRFARPEILTRDAIGQLRQQARLLGSPYGGWYCLPQLIDTSSLVYSFGIGTDLSWDVALIEETGTHVHAFDNTPVSNRWFNKVVRQGKIPRRMHFNLSLEQLQMLRTNLHRHAHLLGTRDGNMTMRLPTGFGESFVDEATGGARGFSAQPAWSAPALTLRSTMRKLHHEKEKIDILKLDVESAEFGLVGEWARSRKDKVPACQLLIEWHERLVPDHTQRASSGAHKRHGGALKQRALRELRRLGFVEIHRDEQPAFEGDNGLLLNPRFCDRKGLRALLLTNTSRSSSAAAIAHGRAPPPRRRRARAVSQWPRGRRAGSRAPRRRSFDQDVAAMERWSGSALHTGSPLSAARCDDLIGKIDLASLWAATPDIAVNGTASREEVASLRFDERRRRPGTAACWDPGQRGEGERYFSRAALGADCLNASWFHRASTSSRGNDEQATARRNPALLGFMPSIKRLCMSSSRIAPEVLRRTDRYKQLALACESASYNILLLWRNGARRWSMCRNFEWLVCAARGKLPQQHSNEIVFANAPSTLRMGQIWRMMDIGSFSGQIVYHAEVCLLSSMCDNGAELFGSSWADRRHRAFRCALNESRLASLTQSLRATDALFIPDVTPTTHPALLMSPSRAVGLPPIGLVATLMALALVCCASGVLLSVLALLLTV